MDSHIFVRLLSVFHLFLLVPPYVVIVSSLHPYVVIVSSLHSCPPLRGYRLISSFLSPPTYRLISSFLVVIVSSLHSCPPLRGYRVWLSSHLFILDVVIVSSLHSCPPPPLRGYRLTPVHDKNPANKGSHLCQKDKDINEQRQLRATPRVR